MDVDLSFLLCVTLPLPLFPFRFHLFENPSLYSAQGWSVGSPLGSFNNSINFYFVLASLSQHPSFSNVRVIFTASYCFG